MFKLLTILVLLFAQPAFAQTKTALGYTPAEINIWAARTTSSATIGGTTFASIWNNRIKNKADAFLSNPTDGGWAGWTGAGCYPSDFNLSPKPGRQNGQQIAAAGFVFLVTGNTAYRDAVRTRLLAQAAVTGTDFSNTSKWCSNFEQDADSHEVTPWLSRLAFAYDFIRHTLSSSDQGTLDAWFLAAGSFWMDTLGRIISNQRFANRPNYTTCTGWACPSDKQGDTHWGGFAVHWFHLGWNNRAAASITLGGQVAAITANTALKDKVKMWVKELVLFNMFSDGTVGDQYRWSDGAEGSENGIASAWTHGAWLLGPAVSAADHFARNGDAELYNYSTSSGAFGTTGGPKTLLAGMLRWARMANNTIQVYGSTNSTTPDSERIRPNVEGGHGEDLSWAIANLFYQNQEVKTAYTRTETGGSGCAGYLCFGGPWGTYPDVLFMFGNNEGVVNPYGTEPEPETDELIGHWKFDENTGTTANDETANNNDGVLTNGATWTTGFSNSAVSLDGDNDYVKIATTDWLNTQGTVALFGKLTSCSTATHYIFGHTTLPQYANRLQLYVDDASCNLDLGLGDEHERHLNIQTLSTGTWYRIVLVWNQGVYAVYVDGVVKATGNYTGLSSLNTHAHIGGVGFDDLPQAWNGAIDEVKIWNYPLTSVEVLADYASYQSLAPPVNLKISGAKTLKVGAGKTLKVGLQ